MSARVYEQMAEAVARLKRTLEGEIAPGPLTAQAKVLVALWPQVLKRLELATRSDARAVAAETRAFAYAAEVQELREALYEHTAHGQSYRQQIHQAELLRADAEAALARVLEADCG